MLHARCGGDAGDPAGRAAQRALPCARHDRGPARGPLHPLLLDRRRRSARRSASTSAEIWELYYTLLLKDLGCSSNAARICQLYLTDDLTFKHDFKRIDGSLPQALRFVLSHTGLKAGLAERFRAIINIFQNGGEIARELIETRCHRGADIARKMRFPEAVALGIQNLDEHWDGGGKPTGAQRRGHPALRPHRAAGAGRRRLPRRQRPPRRRCARSSTAPAPGSTRCWSMAFERVAARPRLLGHAALRNLPGGHLHARTRAARELPSTTTISTTSPPPSPR